MIPRSDIPEDVDDAPTVGRGPGAAPVASRRLGDFRILREVGRGGMGVVYEAEQVSLGRRVALKVLPAPGFGDEGRVRRFEREARAAARLHHTNIVPVFEVGEANGARYYAMQFIDGQGLDAVVAELRRLRAWAKASPCAGTEPGTLPAAPPPPREPDTCAGASALLPGRIDLASAETDRGSFHRAAARLAVQAAGALAHAHARGIVHRDVKPSNLLLDAAGVV